MSDSVAALRKSVGDELRDLAEQHYKHELVVPPRLPQLPSSHAGELCIISHKLQSLTNQLTNPRR